MTEESKTETTGAELTFPEFDDIKVSTRTFTATTNLNIKIDQLFNILPITPYKVVTKKRGRKKKGENTEPVNNVPMGSFVTIKYEGKIRGVELKPKKVKSGKKRMWFRNSITVVIILDKPINFKVCRNGTFQMTGCKSIEHAQMCVKYVWEIMKDHTEVYGFTRGSRLEALFIPSMRNIDFSLGFLVDREKLHKYILDNKKNFFSLLESSFGYTGVNIKLELKKDIRTMEVKKLTYRVKKSSSTEESKETADKPILGKWKEEWTTYEEYLNLLSEKERETKINSPRYVTFLVFHSGRSIMSGLTADFMRDYYYEFIEIIRDAYDKIEERLEPENSNEKAELSLEEELAIMEIQGK